MYSYVSMYNLSEPLSTENVCMLFIEYKGFCSAKGKFNPKDVGRDIGKWVEYMKNRFSAKEIHLYGHSFGAAIILHYIATMKPQGYGKVILVNAFKTFPDAVRDFLWSRIGVFVRAVPFGVLNRLLHNYNSLVNIMRVDKTRLLVIHSKDDEQIPVSHGEELCKRVGIYLKYNMGDHNSPIHSKFLWKEILVFARNGSSKEGV